MRWKYIDRFRERENVCEKMGKEKVNLGTEREKERASASDRTKKKRGCFHASRIT